MVLDPCTQLDQEAGLVQRSTPNMTPFKEPAGPSLKNEQVHLLLVFAPLCCSTWRRQWHPTPVLLPGKSHGWRSLVGCSPWGCQESNTTERLHFYFSLSRIGEGNGNPLQCSCLENPRDGGAWWAAVSGVAQNRTQLKRLSSRIPICRKMNNKMQYEMQGIIWISIY